MIFNLRGITYSRSNTLILDRVDFSMRRGEHWVILGPNGSGKSTLAAILCGMEWPTNGSVKIFDAVPGTVDLRIIKQRIGFFQPSLHDSVGVFHPEMSALEVVLTGFDASLAVYRDYPSEAWGRARDLLKTAFPPSYPPDRPFRLLSSGERRKTLLLRALMGRPDVLLLDEPYESLDLGSRTMLEDLLVQKTSGNELSTVTILHRMEEIPVFATHALLLKEGRLLRQGTIEETIDANFLSQLYDTPVRVIREGRRFACFVGK